MVTDARGYHHGDLRSALVEAGLELTRAGGPGALVVREVTRLVGVSPNAAYRHFADRDALLSAVCVAIWEKVAASMAPPPDADGTERLRTVGLAYIDFALAEPGWFSVAFFGATMPPFPLSPANFTEGTFPPPYVALVAALDAMVDDGALTPTQREGAEWPCFAAVHGFAELALRGPLRELPREVLLPHARRTVDGVIAGLLES